MRRLLLSFALAMSLSAVGASTALAEAPEGAQKAPLFGPHLFADTCEGGATPTPKTFGFAILDTPGNELTLTGEVALKRAVPNTTYQVNAVQSPVPSLFCATAVGTITTNRKGNGNLHFTVARELGATKFSVKAFPAAAIFREEYGSPAVELD
jgi:hypothetical protein